jgi:hypothetical protein
MESHRLGQPDDLDTAAELSRPSSWRAERVIQFDDRLVESQANAFGVFSV